MEEMEFIDKEYTVTEVDELAAAYIKLREEKKDIAAELHKIDNSISEIETKIIEAMKENLKSNWDAHGYKLILKKEKYPKMDKDPESVKRFAQYLEKRGGEEALWSYMSVNHNTLRSLCKQILEENPEEVIPSVDLSFERETLNMRKSK